MATERSIVADDSEPQYDVCLSFAGEQREYVGQVADHLRSRGVRVFYDDAEQVELWGKDLYVHLDWVYQRAARYCVVFASEHYASKRWPSHERASAQARAIMESREYILPVRFDDTEIPGLRPTVHYLDADSYSPERLADAVVKKLGPRLRKNYLPPVPNRLFEQLGLESDVDEDIANNRVRSLMSAFTRMNTDERRALYVAFSLGCTTDLPRNIHTPIDLARRELAMAPGEVVRTLKGLGSLGFEVKLRHGHDSDQEDDEDVEELVEIEWVDRLLYEAEWADPLDDTVLNSSNGAGIVYALFEVLNETCCAQCVGNAIEHLDFGFLADSTADDH